MIHIDGSAGEGGGQVLRTSLALSLHSGKAFHVTGIRAGRAKPGLMRQHLTAVRAAAEMGNAEVVGDHLGSQELVFHPGTLSGGSFRFQIGSAGSTMLVLQTLLPVLIGAENRCDLELVGGTHNGMAPPFEFVEQAFLPLLRHMGARVETELVRPGFFPAGGGQVRVSVEPVARLNPLNLTTRGKLVGLNALIWINQIPGMVAERERATLCQYLNLKPEQVAIRSPKRALGPGNAILVKVTSETVTEVFSAVGRFGVSAEKVAAQAASQVESYLAVDAPVGGYLADQLMVPLAMGSGGEYVTGKLSSHAKTQMALIGQFFNCEIKLSDLGKGRYRVSIPTVKEP